MLNKSKSCFKNKMLMSSVQREKEHATYIKQKQIVKEE